MNRTVRKFFPLSLVAFAAFNLMSLSSEAATLNSSNVNLDITYTFAGAIFTDTGAPAEAGFDFEFDGPPSHFYNNVHTFVFSQGDGSGSVSGSALLGSETHDYPDDPNDFVSVDPNSDSVSLALSTMGQSSTPNSNGSAAIQSDLSFFVSNFTEDPNTFETQSLTFFFDYSYTFDMTLVEDAPAGGAGNGFIEVEAELNEDFGSTSYPGLIQEFFGGPGTPSGGDSGQIEFVTTAADSFAEMLITTNVNSTTLVDVPEPVSFALLLAGGLFVSCRSHVRRRQFS